MLKTILTLSFVLITSINLTAQRGDVQVIKDSLRSVIPTLEWKEQVNAYLYLSNIYFSEVDGQQTIDSLLAIYSEIEAESQKNADVTLQSIIKANILAAYSNSNMLDKAIELAPEYLLFTEKNEVWEYHSIIYTIYSSLFLLKGDSEKSVGIAQEMYEHSKARGDVFGMANAYVQIAKAYESTGRVEEAISYYRRSIDLIKDEDKALQVLHGYYLNLGIALSGERRYEEALQTAYDGEKSIEKLQAKAQRPIPDIYWANIWQIFITVYMDTYDYKNAEIYLDKLEKLDIASPVHKKNNYMSRALLMENYYKDYEKALNFVEKACEISLIYQDYYHKSTLWIKASILSRMGRTDEAMKCIEEAVMKNDSLRNLDFNRQLDELRVIHEVDVLTAEKEKSHRWLIYSLFGCALLIIVLTVWIYYSRRLRIKNINLAKQILEQSRLYEEAKISKNEIRMLRQAGQINKELFDDKSTEEERLFEQLECYMEEQKPYTNPLLNRKSLADAMNTNERYLRDCITKNTGATISDYITQYRLKHANNLLQQPEQDYTIEVIAKESGFGSRNWFHECYRSIYGLTPTEFRNITKK